MGVQTHGSNDELVGPPALQLGGKVGCVAGLDDGARVAVQSVQHVLRKRRAQPLKSISYVRERQRGDAPPAEGLAWEIIGLAEPRALASQP